MSRSIFTPYTIVLKERRAKIALFLVLILTPIIFLQLSSAVTATETTTWDFSEAPVSLTSTASTSDDTLEDFSVGNNKSNYFAMTSFLQDGGIEISKGYAYTKTTNPGLPDDYGYITHSFIENGLVYISTRNAGVYVFDTKSTSDPSDDTFVARYHTGSSPALSDNFVYNAFKEGDLLYMSVWCGGGGGGLHVVDTKGTTNPSDDTLLVKYSNTSSPSISTGCTSHAFKEGNLVYISTSNGFNVINSQGTLSPADDTLVIRYDTGSTPSLANSRVTQAFRDGNYLYLNSYGGVEVIDTKGTLSPADDTYVTRYYTGSTPSLPTNRIDFSFLDGNLLYVASDGLTVINTQGTFDNPADDTLVTRYDKGSTPPLLENYVNHVFLDDDYLYVSGIGVSVINTQGTISPTDDTLVAQYGVSSNPSLVSNSVYHSFLEDDWLYVSTSNGLSVISPSVYNSDGTYLGSPRLIASTPTTSLSVTASTTDDHSIMLSYRTGTTNAVWQDELNTIDSYTADPYGYGSAYNWQTATATNGVLRLSGEPLGSPEYSYFGIDTSFADNYFQSGSVVTMRYRVLNRSTDLMDIGLATDEFEFYVSKQATTDEWQTITFDAQQPFSMILVDAYTYSNSGTELDATTLEIDYIQISTPDIMGEWSSWTTCVSYTSCTLNALGSNPWLQYRVELETDDTSTSPKVSKVVYNGPYQSSFTYTSETRTFDTKRRFTTFVPSVTIPADTSVAYEYSIDGGVTFVPFSPETFEELALEGTSFTWRATLGTTNDTKTPTLTQVSLSHVEAPGNTTSTRVRETTKRIDELRTITSPTAEAVLKEQYPEYFENPDAPLAREKAMVVLLGEIVRLMKELALLRQEEEQR